MRTGGRAITGRIGRRPKGLASLGLLFALGLPAVACGGGTAHELGNPTAPRHARSGVSGRERARNVTPRGSQALHAGERLLEQEDWVAARQAFERALQGEPHNARAYFGLGLALEGLADFDSALDAYAKAASLDVGLAEAHNNLGLLLRRKGNLHEALQSFESAVEADAKLASAHLNLALVHEDLGSLELARKSYRRSVKLEPANPLARVNFGLLLVRSGYKAEALQQLRVALPLARGNAAALAGIGNGLRRAGDPSAGVQAMQAAIAARSGKATPALLAELALAQRAVGEREAAIETLRRALHLDAQYATGHYLLGNMLAGGDRFTEAVTHYERYLALAPEGAHAPKARQRLERARAGRDAHQVTVRPRQN